MKAKLSEDGTVCLDGDILDGAEEAFTGSRYVEAFALLHAYLDWCMIDLVQLSEVVKNHQKHMNFSSSVNIDSKVRLRLFWKKQSSMRRNMEDCYSLTN